MKSKGLLPIGLAALLLILCGNASVFAGHQGGINIYEYVQDKPMAAIDPLGAWSTNVHQHSTAMWAERLDYPRPAAQAVGAADEAVDHGGTSFWPYAGDQAYHFNRNIDGGTDSRLEKYQFHFVRAKAECSKNDDGSGAAAELGTALHPYQDWVAHGDYGLADEGEVWTVHNKVSPQRDFGDETRYPDNPGLDAVGGPDGRPVGAAMHWVFTNGGVSVRGYAIYQIGTQRYRLTKSMTEAALSEFLKYAKESGGCNCRKYFGVVKK